MFSVDNCCFKRIVADMQRVLHARIRQRRKELDLSLTDASLKSGLTKSTWSLIERGIGKRPSVDTIRCIEDALDLAKGELME
jgi:transcriptional regulator with XRE-family HTH domain